MPPENPPPLLLVVQERLKPNALATYDFLETEIARACVMLGCPNPYLALESAEGEKEVWWLNAFSSAEHQQRVEQGYRENEALMSQLDVLAQQKTALTDPPRTFLTKHRPDLSGDAEFELGRARYVVALEQRDYRTHGHAVYESADGTRFILSTTPTRADADRAAERLGTGARIFAVRAAWSVPANEWKEADRVFWGPE
jgi:hypothetical protein